MPDVYRSFFVQAANIDAARAVVAGIPGHDGMFSVPMNAAGTGYRACGKIRDTSPFLAADPKAAFAEVSSASAAQIAQCVDSVDITEEQPGERIPKLEAEAGRTIAAKPWEPGAYAKDEIRSHNGAVWRNLVEGNTFAPGFANWRQIWGTAAEGLPAWVQPSGALDAFQIGEQVTDQGKDWENEVKDNTARPGTLSGGWRELSPTVERWNQPGTVIPGVTPPAVYPTYGMDARVIWDNPNDGGADWIYESNLASNDTEPGRDGTLDRWWTPIERV